MHVWIIEILSTASGKWEPCAEARLTKKDAESAAREWKTNNSHDDFRVKKYVPSTYQRGR